jgi:hypothetical protein
MPPIRTAVRPTRFAAPKKCWRGSISSMTGYAASCANRSASASAFTSARRSGLSLDGQELHQAAVKGRRQPVQFYALKTLAEVQI